jgi:hypothetical protein
MAQNKDVNEEPNRTPYVLNIVTYKRLGMSRRVAWITETLKEAWRMSILEDRKGEMVVLKFVLTF